MTGEYDSSIDDCAPLVSLRSPHAKRARAAVKAAARLEAARNNANAKLLTLPSGMYLNLSVELSTMASSCNNTHVGDETAKKSTP
jgi:hypothetical protein